MGSAAWLVADWRLPRFCSEPGILGRPQVFPCDAKVGIVGVTGDIGACSHEILAVDVNPRPPGGVLCLPEDVSAVVDTVEVNRLAIIVCPDANAAERFDLIAVPAGVAGSDVIYAGIIRSAFDHVGQKSLTFTFCRVGNIAQLFL
jgi:hypothetical protein